MVMLVTVKLPEILLYSGKETQKVVLYSRRVCGTRDSQSLKLGFLKQTMQLYFICLFPKKARKQSKGRKRRKMRCRKKKNRKCNTRRQSEIIRKRRREKLQEREGKGL